MLKIYPFWKRQDHPYFHNDSMSNSISNHLFAQFNFSMDVYKFLAGHSALKFHSQQGFSATSTSDFKLLSMFNGKEQMKFALAIVWL